MTYEFISQDIFSEESIPWRKTFFYDISSIFTNPVCYRLHRDLGFRGTEEWINIDKCGALWRKDWANKPSRCFLPNLNMPSPALSSPSKRIFHDDLVELCRVCLIWIKLSVDSIISVVVKPKLLLHWDAYTCNSSLPSTRCVDSRTTPKVPPPPPLNAKKRSEFWHWLATRNLPSGVTILNWTCHKSLGWVLCTFNENPYHSVHPKTVNRWQITMSPTLM